MASQPSAPNGQSSSSKPPPVSGPPGDSAKPSGRKKGKWRWRIVALIVVLLLVIGAFFYYWFFMRPYESTDDAFIEANVTPIAPQVSGKIIRLLVQDNQLINKGYFILEIDPRDYEEQLAQTQASLQAAQTRFDQAQAQFKADEAKVAQERANIVAAEAKANRAQADLRRYQSLENPAAVSRSQVDLAVAQARSTAADLEVARSAAKSAEAQAALSKAAIQTGAADVKQAEAATRRAQLVLSYTKVMAPVEGFVTHRSVELGAYVQPGQAMLALVPTNLWVTANFKETQLKEMRPGQPVQISVDAYPQHSFRGRVDSIQRGSGARFSLLPPENASGNYVKVVQRVPVKIVFDEPINPNLPLGPGMSVVPKVNVLAKANREAGHDPPTRNGGSVSPSSATKAESGEQAGQTAPVPHTPTQ